MRVNIFYRKMVNVLYSFKDSFFLYKIILKSFFGGGGSKIIVTSIPKSGTHLIEKLLVDFFSFIKFGDGINRMHYPNNEGRFNKVRKKISLLPRSCFISSHLFYDAEIGELMAKKDIKIILMIRDPRDIVASAARYITESSHPYSPHFTNKSKEEVIEMIITGITGPILMHRPKDPSMRAEYTTNHNMFSGILEAYRRFLLWSEVGDALVVKFEDLVGTSGGGDIGRQRKIIYKIAKLCKSHVSDSDMSNIIDNLFGGTSTFRRGRINTWSDEFTEKNKKTFKINTGSLLVDLGYEKDNRW